MVLGPTASGKTRLACQLAYELDGEIISADSRQVYKGLNIGTGKDLDEYTINGRGIAYHLIDNIDPAEQFYLHEFVHALKSSFDDICRRQKIPIICGGTGLYLDALRKDFSLTQIKEDADLRAELDLLPKEALLAKLNAFPNELIKHVDISSKKRIIRGIEVSIANQKLEAKSQNRLLPYRPVYIGINVSVDERKEKISRRLKQRLDSGLVEEAEALIKKGISHERLQRFGLEYKFVSLYLLQQISKEQLFTQLETAIFQYAKRQMTWFRKMEKEGVIIHWVEAGTDAETLVRQLGI